jgi:uncharacterized protein (TIGR02453 family)
MFTSTGQAQSARHRIQSIPDLEEGLPSLQKQYSVFFRSEKRIIYPTLLKAMQNTLEFLEGLKDNNSKDWFLDHMNEFELARTEVSDLAYLILQQLALFDLQLDEEIEVARFISSLVIIKPKKTGPYHTHFGISISPLANDGNEPAYYIHIDPQQSYISIRYDPDVFGIQVIRSFITKNAYLLDEILLDTFSAGFVLNESSALKVMPKGYQPGIPAERYIKLTSYEIICPIDLLKDKEELLLDIRYTFSAALPLVNYLRKGLGLPYTENS